MRPQPLLRKLRRSVVGMKRNGVGTILLWGVAIMGAALCFSPVLFPFVREIQSGLRNHKLHNSIYASQIRPTALWVQSYTASYARLPSQSELDNYTASNYSSSFPVLISTNAASGEAVFRNPGVDFVICVMIGDWRLYFQSWDKKEFKYWVE